MARRTIAAAVVIAVTAPASVGASGAPDPGTLLPDFDIREREDPSALGAGDETHPGGAQAGLAGAQARLERRLGPLGFVDADAKGATGFVGRTDGFLTGRTPRSADRVALQYVREHSAAFGLDDGDVSALALTEAYRSGDGVRHLTFTQSVDGVPSFDTLVRAHVDSDGRLINVSGGPVGDLELDDSNPRLSAEEALLVARENVGGSQSPGFGDLESARLVAFAHPDGGAELAWDVFADTPPGLLYNVVVGADSGRVLHRQSRTAFANAADVWNLHPDRNVPPTRVNLGADPTWIDDTAGGTKLRGNNAHAYADTNNNNVADPAEEVAQVGGDWLFPMTWFTHAECPAFGCTWDSADNSTKTTNQAAATTSLFYLSNRFHDHLLQPPIGFDEASGNFEQVNSSGAGLGGDRVRAEANDGGGLNNANFSIAADGSPPRMQQYFYSHNYDVNSSDDASVVFHEYTHGLTNRLAGLGANQSRAMGEGWSDWYAMDFLVATGEVVDGPGEDVVFGGYTIDFGTGSGGARNQRMDCDPGSTTTFCPGAGTTGPGGFTFGDMGKFAYNGGIGVHDNGEIWSQTLWDLREALGVEDARAVITGGLRLAPSNPSFLQMRDSILQSAATLDVARALIWTVFANRGMGFSASGPNADWFSASEAFDMPPPVRYLSREVVNGNVLEDGDGSAEPGETLRLNVTLDKVLAEGAVTDLTAELLSSVPGTFFGTKRTSWADLPDGFEGTATNTAPMSATIPEGAPCGGAVTFSIVVDSSAGPIPVPQLPMPAGDCSTTVPPLPQVSTNEAAAVGASTATLAAQVNPRGAATSFAFEYGTGDRYDRRTTPQSAGAADSAVTRTTTITGLRPETSYEFRVVALRDNTVIARGANHSLTTAVLGCETARTDLTLAEQRLGEARRSHAAAEQLLSAAEAAAEAAEHELKRAEEKLAKAKRKLTRAKASGDASAATRAKKAVKRAKRAAKRAEQAVDAADADASAADGGVKQAEADASTAEHDLATAHGAVAAHCP